MFLWRMANDNFVNCTNRQGAQRKQIVGNECKFVTRKIPERNLD
jgi:hypothetical protein